MSRRNGRHVGRRRRWPRRLLIGTSGFLVLCLIVAAAGYIYYRVRLGSIPTQRAQALTPDLPVRHGGSGGGGGSDLPVTNILLIGNETRAGLSPSQAAMYGSPQTYSGALSDIIMILHLDPDRGTASLLSIPRDLFVPMPAGSPVGQYQKIDAALNDGRNGPNNLIKAITEDFGIPINHFVELKFDGFQRTVNAIGGINVYFRYPVKDTDSYLNGRAGCNHFNGQQALALVRSRHLEYFTQGYWHFDPESDLARIDRDQTFLKILVTTAERKGFTNPIRDNALLGALINQVTIDPGLKPMLLRLLLRFRHLHVSSVAESTLPVTQVNNYQYGGYSIGDVEFPVEPLDHHVISAWDGGALPDPGPLPKVELTNISGSYLPGTQVQAGLQAAGIHVTSTTTGVVPGSPSETLVEYAPGHVAQGLTVLDHLTGAVMLRSDPRVPAGTVDVQVGTTVGVAAAGPASGTTSSTSTTAPSGSSTTTTTAPSSTTTTAPSSTTTTVPSPGGQTPSASAHQVAPWDPRPC